MSVVKIRDNKQKRKLRVRKKVYGNSAKPRLSVFRSNRYIYGQIIDDNSGSTLASLSFNDVKSITGKAKSKTEAAFELGRKLADVATQNKLKKVVFDKGSYKFHGRVKSFAEGAREGGLDF